MIDHLIAFAWLLAACLVAEPVLLLLALGCFVVVSWFSEGEP